LEIRELVNYFIDGFMKIGRKFGDKSFISEDMMPNIPIEKAESLMEEMEHTIYEVLIPFYQELKLQIELRKEKP
jgi:hypothetical protein